MINLDQLKIGDFGISKIIKHDSYVVNDNKGTFQYVAPERINGDDHDLGSDIW